MLHLLRLVPVVAATVLAAARASAGEGPSEETRARARELSRELTAAPRLAGTSGTRQGAQIVARHLTEAGWKVELDERSVLLSLPRRVEFALYAGAREERPLAHLVEPFDAHADPPGDVPAYSAWSASGRVRAPVVDVGYGLRADYERLERAGVDVRGAIALARYGRAYRGVKVDLATEHGCAGVLLFSDPSEDGAGRGAVWPTGPWKPGDAAQRGSISPMGRAPGDPSTPGFASPPPGVSEPRRVDSAALEDALPRLLCHPIGADFAQQIRAHLASRTLPDATEPSGVGPGPAEVLLELDIPRELGTIVNVVARMEGRDSGLVLAGSHRDAWVRGAQDSGSGCVSLLLAAEELGRRARDGWQPEHSIALAFWDAEEFGLIGSTEWGEGHADELTRSALCYLNADAIVSGTHVGASGTPGMLGLLEDVLARIPPAEIDAESGQDNLWEQWKVSAGERGPDLGLPGSGSDFAVFVHHLGVPMLEVGFGGNGGGGYHTPFDDFAQMERFLDPGWHGHALAGRTLSELLVELATRPGAGFDAVEAARTLAQKARAAGKESPEGGAPWLGDERGERLAACFEGFASSLESSSEHANRARDQGFYRALASSEGLAGRAWFKNRLWTSGLETGYSAETFPTLRAAAKNGPEALERELQDLTRAVGSALGASAAGATASGR
jgi:N-acetylated-alpha-linked acidic dipeptidase